MTFKLTLQGLGQTATRSKFARDIRRALGVPRQAGKVKGLIHGVTASLDPSVDAGLDVNNLSSGRPTTKEKLRHLQHSLSSLLFFFQVEYFLFGGSKEVFSGWDGAVVEGFGGVGWIVHQPHNTCSSTNPGIHGSAEGT